MVALEWFKYFNPFSANVPLLYHLKTSEKLGLSDVFRGYRSGTLVKWLNRAWSNNGFFYMTK